MYLYYLNIFLDISVFFVVFLMDTQRRFRIVTSTIISFLLIESNYSIFQLLLYSILTAIDCLVPKISVLTQGSIFILFVYILLFKIKKKILFLFQFIIRLFIYVI